MACIPEESPVARHRREPGLQWHRTSVECRLCPVVLRKDGFERLFACAILAPVTPRRIVLLDPARIGQHEIEQITCRRSTPDLAGVTRRNELGQQTTEVERAARRERVCQYA